jgi:predicted GNAT family acetyltransferase
MDSVRKNTQSHRFELPLDGGEIAFVDYRETDGIVELTHTEVPDQFEGQGVGRKLVQGTLTMLQQENSKVVPTCAFVSAFIQRHPEYNSLVSGV